MEKILYFLKLKYEKSRIPFWTAMAVGTLTYMFAFTNKLINHDEACSLFAKGAGLSSGRWGLDMISFVFPDFSMPWIYGVISVVLIAIASCVIVHLFDIQTMVLQGLLAGLIMAFPSLIGTFNYMFTASSYALAFFFSVVAVRCFVSNKKQVKALSFLLMILSLSIYQSYIAVAASLFLLLVIRRIIKEEGKSIEIIKQGISYVLFLGIALVCYYVLTQVFLRLANVSMNSYASANLGMNTGVIINRIKAAYVNFFKEFIYGTSSLIPTFFSRMIHVVSMALIGVEMLVLCRFKKKGERIFLMLMVCLLPLSINCMYLFVEANAIHTLVLYSFISVYVLAIIIIEECTYLTIEKNIKAYLHSFIRQTLLVAMLAVITINVYVGNQTYLHLYLKYENAYAFYTSLITQVKMTQGFDDESKLALVGDGGYLVNSQEEFGAIKNISGANGFSVNSYSRDAFIINYIGIDIPFASSTEIEEIRKTSEFRDMEVYPYYGSIEKIGDYVVVKLSEN